MIQATIHRWVSFWTLYYILLCFYYYINNTTFITATIYYIFIVYSVNVLSLASLFKFFLATFFTLHFCVYIFYNMLLICIYAHALGFPGGSVKNFPAMQETRVWFLGGEDPLQKGMANHSHKYTCVKNSINMGSQRIRYDLATE